MPFQAIKTTSSKSRKMTIFSTFFFFRQHREGKCLLRYTSTKKYHSKLSKQEVQNVEKWPFFQRRLTHGFDPKMTIFPTFFFWQYRPGTCLLRYSRTTKMPFQAIKKEVQKVKKLTFFPKGLTHIYGPKMAIFATFFFLGIIGQENVFYDIPER